MIDEIWKPIPGFGGHYEASNIGNVRVKARVIVRTCPRSGVPREYKFEGKQLKKCLDKKGYLSVHIGVDCKRTKLKVHRAVLMAFVGLPPEGHVACHFNGISTDNRIENLRWDTHIENSRDRRRHGTYYFGENNVTSKYSEKDIREIKEGKISSREAKEKIGISRTQFSKIKRGIAWGHIAKLPLKAGA